MISDPTNNEISIYAWSEWSAWSATCGTATRSRHLVCEPEGSASSLSTVLSTVQDLQKKSARDWVNADANTDFRSQMELGQGNCVPQWSEWTERVDPERFSEEDKVRHIKELVDIYGPNNLSVRDSLTLTRPLFLKNINHESNITMKLKIVKIQRTVQFTANGLPGQNAVERVVKVFVPDRPVPSMLILLPMISDFTKLELVTIKTVVSFFIKSVH